MSTTETPHADHTRPRSPGYPAIDLKAALDRARLLYQAEGRNRAPVTAILGHWGYKQGSGAGMVALAALKKFGLLLDEGSGAGRKARLSEDALRILLDERDNSSDRQALIRKAALKPAIYNTLWTKHQGELPSDPTLRHELIFDHSFTDVGASEFIGPFRTTVAYARLNEVQRPADADIDDSEEEPDEASGELPGSNMQAPPSTSRTMRQATQEISIPLAPGEYATVRATFPMTNSKWEMMLSVLQAMKSALVVPEQEPTD